jgi:hypothetical protein
MITLDPTPGVRALPGTVHCTNIVFCFKRLNDLQQAPELVCKGNRISTTTTKKKQVGLGGACL